VSSKITYLFLLVVLGFGFSVKGQNLLTSEDVMREEGYNPLSPATAAFYSAIIPGLGQAYNKDYWKIPIVYGAMATSMYYFVINNDTYKQYRTAFKLREAGYPDEFTLEDGTELISRTGLMNAQKTLKQNRETSLLMFAAFYVLQIVDASVSAHLLQFNVSDKISFDPQLFNEPANKQTFVGLTLNYNF